MFSKLSNLLSSTQDSIKNTALSTKNSIDEARKQREAELQQKKSQLLGTNSLGTNSITSESKYGRTFNPYKNFQYVLDNPNVSQGAKDYLSKRTGLSPTISALNDYNTSNSNTTNTTGTSHKLGFISAKYETSGYDGGAVSSGNGDFGGVSYGIPQFSTTAGSADKFVSYLKQSNPNMAKYFGNSKAGSTEFSNAWKQVYSIYGDDFSTAQTQYAYNSHVKPLVELAKKKTGIDYTRSTALLELVYSTAIQFGSGSLGLSALGNVSANMSDTDIINASYDKKIANYKSYFKGSSSAVQEGVKNRFINERNDVLALVGTNNKTATPTNKSNTNTNSNGSNNSFNTFGNHTVTASYGQKGKWWSSGYHQGVDYNFNYETVTAPISGTVTIGDQGNKGFGKYVVITDDNGYKHYFAHLSQFGVSSGQYIKAGTKLGVSGNTGNSTGPHLHYEVRNKNGVSVNPNDYK